jgi:hypothetical protein
MVDFGFAMTPADYAIQPIEPAKAVEERGLESLFFLEHTHIPVASKIPFPMPGGLPTSTECDPVSAVRNYTKPIQGLAR